MTVSERVKHDTRIVVVTGATGRVGRHVVDGLVEHGCSVRAMSRDPAAAGFASDVEVVAGDLLEPAKLGRAFASAHAVVLTAIPDTIDSVLVAARTAGIQHIVVVSSAAVTAGYDTTYNLPVELAVRACGLEWSIVRPGEFATNALLIWGPAIRQHRRVVEPFPDQVGNPIHERDVADVIVADLLDPRRRGRIDTIIGPQALSKREQVATIADAIGEDIRLDEVTAEEARAFYSKQGGFAANNADFLFGFESYDGVEGVIDEPIDINTEHPQPYLTLAEVTGHPARSYARWAHDHAMDFT